MAKKAKTTKKRNPADATGRNIRASRKRDNALGAQVDALRADFDALAAKVDRIDAARGVPE